MNLASSADVSKRRAGSAGSTPTRMKRSRPATKCTGRHRRALTHAEHPGALSPEDQAWQQVVEVIRQAAGGR